MPLIKINGINYDAEALSPEVKAHLQRLAFIEAEVERVRLQMDVLFVAREEIGVRLDRALVSMELNQEGAPAQGTSGQEAQG